MMTSPLELFQPLLPTLGFARRTLADQLNRGSKVTQLSSPPPQTLSPLATGAQRGLSRSGIKQEKPVLGLYTSTDRSTSSSVANPPATRITCSSWPPPLSQQS